ncbi:hypothetical protein Tco_0331658 [Tanacetum coccineum]
MVAYLEKSEGSEGFHEIIDFLNASHIKYALTKNPTIYVSFIKQFWNTATARTRANGEVELKATIDGQVKTLTEASIRRHLKLEDNDGVTSLPNSEIFEQLAAIYFPKSNIATAIICLASNMTFNLLKMIFDAMVKNVDSQHKFLMYLRFTRGYSRVEVALFPTMLNEPITSPSRITSSLSLSPEPSPPHTSEKSKDCCSKDEDAPEDCYKQWRKISDIDQDPNISLVQDEPMTWDTEVQEDADIQKRSNDDTEVLLDEQEPTELVEDQGNGKEEVTSLINLQTYTRRTREVSTGSGRVSTASRLDSNASEKAKDKGKAIMTEPEPKKKSKKQL